MDTYTCTCTHCSSVGLPSQSNHSLEEKSPTCTLHGVANKALSWEDKPFKQPFTLVPSNGSGRLILEQGAPNSLQKQ